MINNSFLFFFLFPFGSLFMENLLMMDLIWTCAQQLDVLKTENQRLRDENGALIRVISKLSK